MRIQPVLFQCPKCKEKYFSYQERMWCPKCTKEEEGVRQREKESKVIHD